MKSGGLTMKTKDSAIKHIDVNHRKSVLPMTHSDFIGKHCDLRMTIRGDFVGKKHGKIWKCRCQLRAAQFHHAKIQGLTLERNSQILPSGKLSHNYGKSPFLMGKSTISMVIFNSYVKLPDSMIFSSLGVLEDHGNQQKLGYWYCVFFGGMMVLDHQQ
jgi:hypothetical protein